jgi:two-component system, LytTR family, sensor kinase
LYRWRIKTAKKSQKQQTEIQRLAAQEYKNQLELTQISNYFSTSVMHLETIDEVLWDVAKKLIGELGFEDCMIYLWDKDKTKLIQKAGYGPKGSIEEINKQPFDVVLGQGVVGYVAQYKESVLIADTRKDIRYRPDEMERLSEICVPILDQNQLIGIIDSENSNLNFYTPQHLQILTTIATNLANKITEIKSKQAIKENEVALQKTQDLLRNAQLEALRSQMNPHFIFNCLNSIKLYTTQNNTEAAVNYLTKFSKLIRMALENSRSQMVSLQNELDALELYIELEAMRFKDKLQYTITVHNDVDTEFIEIPPLLLQPFVENAIWHGIMHKEEGGNIDITIDYTSGHEALLIKILDNGIGRAKSAQLKSKSATTHKSFGTKVTHERVDIINQIYKTGASVTTKDVIENGMVAGTLVTIKIPLV